MKHGNGQGVVKAIIWCNIQNMIFIALIYSIVCILPHAIASHNEDQAMSESSSDERQPKRQRCEPLQEALFRLQDPRTLQALVKYADQNCMMRVRLPEPVSQLCGDPNPEVSKRHILENSGLLFTCFWFQINKITIEAGNLSSSLPLKGIIQMMLELWSASLDDDHSHTLARKIMTDMISEEYDMAQVFAYAKLLSTNLSPHLSCPLTIKVCVKHSKFPSMPPCNIRIHIAPNDLKLRFETMGYFRNPKTRSTPLFIVPADTPALRVECSLI